MSRAALGVPPHAAATAPPPPALTRALLLLLCVCAGTAQGMVAAVNLLITRLAASALHPTPGQLLWTVDAYVIVFAGLLIPAGALGDRYGRKQALVAGLALFALGAAVSAAAPDVALLITGRALCGAGAALIMPATLALVVQLTGPADRAGALAAWTLALGVGGLAGNLLGGVLGQFLSWRALFALAVPLAALLAVLTARRAPASPQDRAAALDPLGSVLLIAAVLALVDGIVEGPHRGWDSARVLLAFGAAALLALGFAGHALRTPRPLFDPRLLRSPRLCAGLLGTALSFFGLFGLFFVNAQYLQDAKGYSPTLTGLAVAPVTVGMILVPRLAARLAPRTGHAPLAVGGLALIGAGLLLLAGCDADTPYGRYAAWLVLLSVGSGLCMPSLTATVVGGLPARRAGLGSGLNTAAREIGAALGVAVSGSLLAGHPGHVAAGMDAGLRVVGLVVLVGCALVAAGYAARPRRG
ncbi:MFS transporter [Kitasatospora sp. NPDC058965]|uniref:MFS transporter n=1 Tax=Kitasatospora sp. NPDC058965 TaxID=3346682 RepID=UPI00368DBFCE